MALILLAAPQGAAAAGTVTIPISFRADFVAGAGEVNKLTITSNPGVVIFRDDEPGATINEALMACEGNGTNEVTCTLPTLTVFIASLGDMDDTGTAEGPMGGTINGGDGVDVLTGSDVNERFEALSGEGGPDILNSRNTVQPFGVAGEGGPGSLAAGDLVSGGEENDVITTGNGFDSASGGNGVDVIRTGEGDDSASGGDGDGDLVDLGPGNDRVTKNGDDGSGDVLEGGPGVDLLAYQASVPGPVGPGTVFQSFTIDLLAGTASQTGTVPEVDTATGFEDVETTVGADAVTGTAGANSIHTGSANDQVNPGDGADQVNLVDGGDSAATSDGYFDRVACGTGTDTVQADQLDELFDCESVTITQVRPAGADFTAPRCRLSGVRKRYRRKALLSGVRVRASCDEPAALAFRLVGTLKRRRGGLVIAKPGDVVLAERTLRLGTGTRRARLNPPKRLRAALRRVARARLIVEARDEVGNRATLTRKLRVRK
jgi:RTX calcium-binding nonapeptide repeat (4 copies)